MPRDDDTARDPPPLTMQLRPGQHPDDFAPSQATIQAPRDSITNLTPPAMPSPRYELGDEIARGGMGRVVNANDTRLGRTVALKEALALDAESLRRFDRETQITARLEHPSIVPVHDAGKMADGTPFYVMRKIGGRPLEKLVSSAETLADRLALIPHIVAAAHAVAHAHERGIIHRDIKPSNILCGELGETIVIDWGLAKVKGEPDEETGTSNWVIEDDDQLKTRAGIVFGTPGFMAPEQLRGNAVNERTDVHALGATLYHLLSRKPPHHAKTADEMMRLAVRAKPTPLGQLVAGVSPELITIVDKALAMDHRTRYQSAKELADDLQRFLKGQLVASHHYTPREKFARFVKKNKVPLIAVSSALIGLIIIGTVAVVRVINERDRADVEAIAAKEQREIAIAEKLRSDDRLEKLTLQQARSKAITNPTEAIAMLKPLAVKQWHDVRSIASAARATGVAWSFPAPKHVESLEMSRDGQRVLIAGGDGSVQIYDLATRTSKKLIGTGQMQRARFADGETKVVAWAGKSMTVLDSRSGAQIGAIQAPTNVVDLEVVGVNAYWADEGKKVWRLDLAGSAPVEMPLDEGVRSIAPSPDGRWIAMVADNHLLLHDRTQPAEPPQQIIFGRVQDLDWSDDGGHLAMLVELGAETERVAADASIATGGQIVHRVHVGARTHIAWSRERMFTIGPQGVGVVSRNETTPRKQITGAAVGLRETVDGAMVAASAGALSVLTDDGDHVIPMPEGRLEIFETSTKSPFVVGFTEGRLLVWNLADVLPRRIDVRRSTIEAFTGNDRVLSAFPDSPAEWLDLATTKRVMLPALPSAVTSIDGSTDGRAACVVDASHHAKLVTDAATSDLGAVDLCVFANAGLILGTSTGILLVDPETKLRTPLVSRTTRLVHVVASRGPGKGSVAAAFLDATLWRVDLASGKQSTTPASVVPPMIAIQPDGTMVFPEGKKLTMWQTDNALRTIVELPKPIDAVGLAGSDRAVVYLQGGIGYVVELATGKLSAPFDLSGVSRATQAPDTGTLVFAYRGSIEVMDPIANHRWTLATSPGLTFLQPQISSSGARILARRDVTDREKRDVEKREEHTLLAWQLIVPATPDDTARWLDRMTNANVDKDASLIWR